MSQSGTSGSFRINSGSISESFRYTRSWLSRDSWETSWARTVPGFALLSALFCGCPCCKKKDHEQIEEETRHGDVRDYYVIKEKLGAGGFAQVRRADLKSEGDDEYAVKI